MNPLGPRIQKERPRVATFGGAKGGAGRSTVSAEIARSMARSGQRILCVDASLEFPSLNTLLHAEEPNLEPPQIRTLGSEGSHVADLIQETGYRNIWLAALAQGREYPFVRGQLAGDLLIEQLHELDFDWVFIDLPPGIDPFPVTLFVCADLPILISTPEPASIRATTQFLRASIYQAIGFHPNAYALKDDILDTLYAQRLCLSRESLLRAAPSAESRKVVLDTLEQLETYLIVNMVREGAERDLGHVLTHALYSELGNFPRYLGSVDFEDRRWFYNRRTAANPSSTRGEEALSNDVEQLARYVLDIRGIEAKYPRPAPRGQEAHPALRIGLSQETGRNEVRQWCRRLWEGYRRETSINLVFSDMDKRLQIADQLETTYRSILTMQTEPTVETEAQPPTLPPRSQSNQDAPDKRSPPRPKPGPEGDTKQKAAGKLITSLRKQRQMSLQDLSLRTHIGLKYLTAIEEGDAEILPRPVYLRGYLREIARVFGVEPDELIDQYFGFLGDG